MPKEEPNLEHRIDDLLESLESDEIRDFTFSCIQRSVSIAQIRTYLAYMFGYQEKNTLNALLPSAEKEDELLNNTKKLKDFLETLDKALVCEYERNRDILGIKKERIKKMLASYSKLATYLKAPIKEQVKDLEGILDDLSISQPTPECSLEDFKKAVGYSREISSSFVHKLEKIQSEIAKVLHVSPKDGIAELVTSPDGIRLDSLHLKTIQDLYNTNLRQFLRLVLSE